MLEDSIWQFDKALEIDDKLELAINNRKIAIELLQGRKSNKD